LFKQFELTFSPECGAYVEQVYARADLIVEYGSGGSTMLAAKSNKTVLTVESSIEWLMELMASYKEQGLPGDIIPLWADIGPIENWGYPDDESAWKKWPDYAQLPWRYCREHALAPDLVLIDGRFRVASFVACCVNTTRPVTILFDDYSEREHYHCTERICKPDIIIDERMAVFNVLPGMLDSSSVLEFMPYFHDPR